MPRLRIVGGGGIRIARLGVRKYTDSCSTRPKNGIASVRTRPSKSVRSETGFTTAPESRCDPGCLPFSSTATGTSPSRSASSGASSSSCPRRIAHASPAGPAPTMRIPTSISGSPGAATNSEESNGGL